MLTYRYSTCDKKIRRIFFHKVLFVKNQVFVYIYSWDAQTSWKMLPFITGLSLNTCIGSVYDIIELFFIKGYYLENLCDTLVVM